MSKTVDERVVEMRFDNKQFESNVQTSLSTLDKLKKSLDMNGATKGLESVDAAAKNCNLSGFRSAVETVQVKFSALETIAVTALANIANSAVNTGKKMLRSLSIEPISQGFQEYELKMGSIQTIMASTGEDLETVNGYLDELNTYADKTIYSFSDMTNNIGKFTNAGVKLEDAVKAIQGISNEAAVSGANSNEASRAMYNFAQALSAGYVKLIDWKSIENANMATVEFKDKLLETALSMGTVVKVGDKYQTTTTDANGKVSALFDATSNFNDSLSAQWMTTDVLVKTLGDYADETTEIGKKAFAAAQDVKTFTQLMDTLKEAAGSGWAATWEIVFGNFEEAKELWTNVSEVVGGFIDAQSDARNSLLQEWKDLGGRAKLIEALKNAFDGLVSVLKPVSKAFREIFPRTTAQQLYVIIDNFAKFTARLKLSDKASENLKATFKGMFAVLDIVKRAFSAVLKAITPLFGGLDDLGGGVLGVTGKIGKWLTKLDDIIKKSDIFNKVLQNIVKFVQGIPKKIDTVFKLLTGLSIFNVFEKIRKKASDFLNKLKEIFSGFGKINTNGIDTLSEKTEKAFKPFVSLFDGIKKIFGGIWELVKKLSPIFSAVSSAVGKSLGSVGSAISNAIKDADFKKVLDLVNGGVLVSIGVGIKKFIGSLTDVGENTSGILETLKGMLNGVKGCFEAWQKDIKANSLLKIAAAVGILAVSLVVISGIESGKLFDALTAITALFAELAGVMMVMGKANIGKSSLTSSATLIAMATSVLILASALKKLSGLDIKGVAIGITAIAGLSSILVIVSKQLSKNSEGLIKGSLGLIAFAAAIRLLSKPVKDLGELDIKALAAGLIGVGVLCAELALFLKVADLDKMSLGKGLGLMALSEGIRILADAVGVFASLDISALIKGLAGVGVVLAEIAAFMKLTNNSKGLMSTAVGMTILGASMLIFGKAINNIGNLSIDTLAKGLIGLGVALVEVAIAMKLMPSGAKIIAAGTGLAIVGASMKIFSSALSTLGDMSWEELARGLVAMAAALAEIVIALKIVDSKALAGASAVLVCSAALAMLVPVLAVMGAMSWESIAKGLLTIAGVFTILGVAGYLLKPVTGTIIALSGALALIGVAAVAFGAGLLTASIALSTFAGSATILVAAIVDVLIGLVTAIPDIVSALAKSLGEAIPAIVDCISAIATSLLIALNDVVPLAVEVLLNIVQEVLSSFATHIQEIVESLLQIVVGILDGLAAGIPQVISSAVNLFKAVLDSLVQALGGFDIGTILTATASLAAVAAMMSLLTIIAAEAVVATAVLPIIGTNLNKFIQNAQPFLDEIQKVDTASLQGAKNLAETVLILTAAGIIDSLTSWFTGGKSFVKFGEQLSDFAPYLKKYYMGIKGIDADVVERSANAAKALSKMANELPNSGGVLGFLMGENDIDDFGKRIVSFGRAMVTYSQTVSGKINSKAVETSASAGRALSELAKNLPNTGGLIDFFTGGNDLASFGEKLVPFGEAIAKYSEIVSGKIDKKAVETSASAGKTLVELSKTLPDTGGLIDFFTGGNDLASFGEKLVPFGEAIAKYSEIVSGKIDKKAVETSASAGQSLVELSKTLPDTGGLVDFFTGGNDLASFGEKLVPFGEAMAKYSETVSGKIDEKAVTVSTTAGQALVELSKTLPDTGGLIDFFTGGNDLASFGEKLVPFGEAIKAFSLEITGMDADAVSNAAIAGEALANMAATLPEDGGIISWFTGSSDMTSFAEQLVPFGNAMKRFSLTVSGIDGNAVQNASTAGLSLAEMAATLPSSGGIVSWFTGCNDMDTFGKQIVPFGKAMKEFSNNVTGIDGSAITASATAGKTLAELANTLPPSGGIISWFTGSSDMTSFGEQLVPFGRAMHSYSDAVSGIEIDAVNSSATAGKALVELSNTLPKTGGVFDWFTGTNDIELFGKQLEKFGQSFALYANYVSDIDPEVVTATADAGDSLVSLSNSLPQTGGITSWFTGSKDIGVFGESLKTFGSAFAGYYENIRGIDSDKLSSSLGEIETLIGIANNMNEIDINGMSSFSESLKKLGESGLDSFIRVFSDSTQRVKNTANDMISTFANEALNQTNTVNDSFKRIAQEAAQSLNSDFSQFKNAGYDAVKSFKDEALYQTSMVTEAFSQISQDAYQTLSNKCFLFKNAGDEMITAFANEALGYSTKVADVFKQIAFEAAEALSNDNSHFKNAGYDAVKAFKEEALNQAFSVSDNFKQIAKNAVQALTSDNSQFYNAGSSVIERFVDGMKEKSSYSVNLCDDFLSDCLVTISGYYSNFSLAGKYMVEGFADGIDSNTYIASARATEMARAASDAAKKELDEHSPSKVGYEIGDYFGVAFVNAIGKYTDIAYDSGSEIASSAKNGLSNAISKIGEMINDGVDVQPTIRPVFDLSDIKSGTDKLYGLMNGFDGYLFSGSVELADKTRQSVRTSSSTENDSIVSSIHKLNNQIEKLASNPPKTLNNTFNISGNDPKEIANQVSKIIQTDVERRNTSWA